MDFTFPPQTLIKYHKFPNSKKVNENNIKVVHSYSIYPLNLEKNSSCCSNSISKLNTREIAPPFTQASFISSSLGNCFYYSTELLLKVIISLFLSTYLHCENNAHRKNFQNPKIHILPYPDLSSIHQK